MLVESGITTSTVKGQYTMKLGTAGGTNGYYGVKLFHQQDLLTNWSEIVNLFKFYKIHSVTYYFTFIHNGSPYQTNTVTGTSYSVITGDALPSAFWVYDKENWPTATFPDIREYEGVRQFQFGNRRQLRITYKPILFNTVQDVYSNATQQAVRSPWCDTNNAMNHGGVTMGWFNPDATNGAEFIVHSRVRFSVKQMR